MEKNCKIFKPGTTNFEFSHHEVLHFTCLPEVSYEKDRLEGCDRFYLQLLERFRVELSGKEKVGSRNWKSDILRGGLVVLEEPV